MSVQFHHVLAAYRERLGMSQATLAQKCDISPSYYNRIEKGYRFPSTKVILALVQELHLSTKEANEFVQLAGLSPRILPRLVIERGHKQQLEALLKRVNEIRTILQEMLHDDTEALL